MSAALSVQRFHCVLPSSACALLEEPESFGETVADAILDAHRRLDPRSDVLCDVYTGVGKIVVAGEVRSSASVDVEQVARRVLRARRKIKIESQGPSGWPPSEWPEWVI
jgi:hypothetical protein